VLVRLERIGVDELRELVEEAWVLRAPPTVSRSWLAEQGGQGS
jgi:hypothetical protein